MSADDTLSRLIRDEGSRKGVFTGRFPNPEKAAEAAKKVKRYSALRARLRADAGLVAAGIDPANFADELRRVVS